MRTKLTTLKALGFSLFAVVFFQCSEQETDSSALINCDLSLFSNAAMQGKITINQAVLNLEQIQVTGTQPSLSIVSFSRNLSDQESKISLISNDQAIVRVDAERNDYDPLSLTLTLKNDDYSLKSETSDAGSFPDLNDYLTAANPAFLLGARFDNRGRSVPVFVAFPEVMPLKSVAEQYGSVEVTIDVENLAEVQINPNYLFDGITTQQLEGASRVAYQNQEVIFIHPSFNTELYNSLLTRLEDAQNSVKVKVRVTRSASDQ